MKSKESAPYEDEVNNKEEQIESERISFLWAQYGFPGNPPRIGTGAYDRLKDYCRSYTNFLVDEIMSKGNTPSISEPRKRELHNNIALMTTGRERSSMSNEEGVKIVNFASELIFGQPIELVYEDLRKSRENQE